MDSQASSIQENEIQGDLTLKVVCSELGSIKTKSYHIGIQLGIPRNKLQELKKDDDPLSAIVDYWLQGNVTDNESPISWKSIVEALKSEYVGEPALAEHIRNKYCPKKEEIPHDTNRDSSATSDTAAKTSNHDDSKLHPDVKMDLDFILQKNIKGIIYQYGSYVDCLCDRVIAKGVTPEKLRTYLLSIFATSKTCDGQKLALLADKKEELEKCNSVNAIFDVLTTQCASFLNYEIFQGILKNFGISEDFERLKYSEHLEAYVRKHTVSEFTTINPLLKTRKGSAEFIVKFDIETTCRLARITELRMILAEILGINPSALEIVDIKDGCVVVKFLISGLLADAIFTPKTVFTSQQEDDFEAAQVLWLKCNGQTFRFGEKEGNAPVNDCPICLATYSDLEQLQCKHACCQQCLMRLVVQNPQGQLSMTCPKCRQMTHISASRMAHLQPTFQLMKEQEKVNVVCPEHNGNEVKFYCETCKKTICLKCTKEHYNHQYEELNEAFEEYKREIKSSLRPLDGHLKAIKDALITFEARRDEIRNQQTTIVNDIHKKMAQFYEVLKAHELKLIEQVHQLTQNKLKSLSEEQKKIETIQAKLESISLSMNKTLTTDNKAEALMTKINLMKELNSNFELNILHPSAEANMIYSTLEDLRSNVWKYGEVFLKSSPNPLKSCIVNGNPYMAAVGKLSTATLQIMDSDNAPCEMSKNNVSSYLYSERTFNIKSNYVEIRGRSQYKISYKPTMKGRHYLHVKINSHHIKGSPFLIHARSPIEKLGIQIQSVGSMWKPEGVAVNQNGEVVVTELDGHCVTVFSPIGMKIRSFGTQGSTEGKFKHPCGVAVDGEGNILVADRDNHRIQKFTAEGRHLKTAGTHQDQLHQLHEPWGITVNHQNGRIYVVSKRDCIHILNSDLSYLATFGQKGRDQGYFNKPQHIACDKAGNVYVADCGNNRFQVFTAQGDFLRCSFHGQLNSPHGIAIDFADRVYVSEFNNNHVSVFSSEGQFLTRFLIPQVSPFSQPNLHGLAVDSGGVVYVCNENCVKLF